MHGRALQALSTSTPSVADDDLGDLTADELKECLKEHPQSRAWVGRWASKISLQGYMVKVIGGKVQLRVFCPE